LSQEGQLLDKKSLRAVLGKTANWSELAKDCIAFANSLGGTLLIGIEDGQDNPPLDQTIPPELAECTVNVAVLPAIRIATNGGQFIALDEHLARLFHDLKLMEREGSGFDKIYETLLSQGRPAPEIIETHDRVQVSIRRRILKPEVIDFIAKADQTYQLTQRERIALGLLTQQDALTARELATALELATTEALQAWLKRLLEWGLVKSAGRTQATRYFVDPALLRNLQFASETTLKRIEPHRLAALVLEDLARYPQSAISDIHQRIGGEIHPKQVKRTLEELTAKGSVRFEGDKLWRRYWAVPQ
jgi:ATP-dependent DNA helicase RecG